MENGEEFPLNAATATITRNDEQQQQQHLAGRTRSSSTSSGHQRSLSGSLLSKFTFLRMSQTQPGDAAEDPIPSQSLDLNGDDEYSRTAAATARDENIGLGAGGSKAGGGGRAMATAIQHQRRMRRRKGSLRKTALLGTRLEFRERRNSASTARDQNGYANIENAKGGASSPLTSSSSSTPTTTTPTDEESTPRGSMERNNSNRTISSASSSYSAYWPRSLTMDRGASASTTAADHQTDLSKPATSTSLAGDITDDEEEDNLALSPFDRGNRNIGNTHNTHSNNNNQGGTTAHLRPSSASSSGSGIPPLIATTPSSSSDSYFLPHRQVTAAANATDSTAHHLGHPLTTHRARSPLVTHSNIEIATNHHVGVEVGWDYSETESWGWIILIVTWLVFVVGIGSSFGVWSWAWDVGETPYAPPELEDDPTLPIVGYYPALMVLTAVMAWVWVIVAWVGMKYFKHANISADDGL